MTNGTIVKTCVLAMVPDAVTYVMCAIGIVTIIVTFFTNLLMACYFRKMKSRMGGMVFYRCIIYISMFACLIGQPVEMANALMKTSVLPVNLISNICLFFLFCATYHCIAGLTFERYIAIKRDGKKKELEKKFLIVIITALVFAMCVPKFYNLYHIIVKRHHCELAPDSWLTLASMCTWLTYCSISISVLTTRAIKFVKDYDEIRKETLGKSRVTNIKRLKVTKKIWMLFSVLWIPYGAVNIFQTLMSVEMYETSNAIARGFTSISFAVLPGVYYFMDKKYKTYVDGKMNLLKTYIPCWNHTDQQKLTIRNKSNKIRSSVYHTDISVSNLPHHFPSPVNPKVFNICPITEEKNQSNAESPMTSVHKSMLCYHK